MFIEVKGINDALLIKMNENATFDQIIDELYMLLDQPIFKNDGYYPRAYFDLGSRILKEDEFYCLLQLLQQKKCFLFQGVSLPLKNHAIQVISQPIFSGEIKHVYEDTLFLSPIHPGSYIYFDKTIFFLNIVQGHIISNNTKGKIYGQQFQNATIMINQSLIHNLTTSALTSVYYKDGHIVLKEDEYEQNYRYYFR